MEIKRYWQVLWKRRLVVLSTFAVATTGALFYSANTPPVYQASVKLLLEQKDGTLSEMAQVSHLSSISRTGTPLDTQAELLRSVPILTRVISDLNLRDPQTSALLTTSEFLRNGKVTNIKGTDLLQLSYRHADPFEAKRICDAWARTFLEDNRLVNRREATNAVTFIGAQLGKTREELKRAEVAVRDYKQRHAALSPTEDARSALLTLSNLETELRQTDAAYREASARLGALRKRVGLNPAEALASTAASQEPSIQRLRQQLLEAETDPILAQGELTASNPKVQARRAQVAALRARLKQEASTVIGSRYMSQGLPQTMDPVRQGLTSDMIQAEVATLGLQSRLASLKRLTTTYQQRVNRLPETELHVTRLERTATLVAERFKTLEQNYEQAKLQEAMNIGNVRIVDTGGVPSAPDNPGLALLLLVGGVAGVLAGVAGVMFVEYLDESIKTPEEAAKALKLTSLGVIPWLKQPRAAQLAALKAPRSPAAEAYRSLRSNLRFLAADRPIQALVFTSAGAHEGKSTTVANLALSLVQSGKRVLLVDADMRRPSQHEVFSLSNKRGLSTVLCDMVALSKAVQAGPIPGLDILTSGPAPASPVELLESPRMAALLAEARTQYDMILFDAPPVIAVTDAQSLATIVDGAVLNIGINRVTRDAARQALARLKASRGWVAGMVVHGMRPDNDWAYASYNDGYFQRLDASRPPMALLEAPKPPVEDAG
jgi:capsular exopolysaccharide synthesis family protein